MVNAMDTPVIISTEAIIKIKAYLNYSPGLCCLSEASVVYCFESPLLFGTLRAKRIRNFAKYESNRSASLLVCPPHPPSAQKAGGCSPYFAWNH